MENNKKGNTKNSLVLGIISIIISGCGYMLGISVFFCCIAGLIAGIVSVILEIVRSKKNGNIDKLGIIIGIIAVIVAVIVFADMLSLFVELKNAGEIG